MLQCWRFAKGKIHSELKPFVCGYCGRRRGGTSWGRFGTERGWGQIDVARRALAKLWRSAKQNRKLRRGVLGLTTKQAVWGIICTWWDSEIRLKPVTVVAYIRASECLLQQINEQKVNNFIVTTEDFCQNVLITIRVFQPHNVSDGKNSYHFQVKMTILHP